MMHRYVFMNFAFSKAKLISRIHKKIVAVAQSLLHRDHL